MSASAKPVLELFLIKIAVSSITSSAEAFFRPFLIYEESFKTFDI